MRVLAYRSLILNLVLRNMKVKYQRSFLGFFWTLLNPVIVVAVLTVIFSIVVRIPIEHYWAFLLSGYFAWNFLSSCISASTYTIAEHAYIIRNVAFPSEALVVSAALSRFIEYLAELAIIVVVLAWLHLGHVPASFALLPLLLVLQLLLAIGIQLPIATLSVFYKDVDHAVPIALLALFYVSPVFYPASMIPEPFQALYLANPVAQLLTLYHTVLYEGAMPGPALVAAACATTALVALGGYAIFRRFDPLFAEVV
jgi:ABC-type polysaccharide/polyol phosphate export permease